jgi:magnesium transporter
MEPIVEHDRVQIVELVLQDLEQGNNEQIQATLTDMHAAEQAYILESLPPMQRRQIWHLVEPHLHGEVLTHLREEVRLSIIGEMPDVEIVAAAGEMDVEDLAEVLEDLPEKLSSTIIDDLEQDYRERLEMVRSFNEGTVGRLMSHDVVSIRADVNIAVVGRWLRLHGILPIQIDSLMVIDDDGHYLGKLDVSILLTSLPDMMVADLMRPNVDFVSGHANQHDLLALFERRDLLSVAVVDDENILIGRIGVDDILDLMREESERTLMNQAGLDQEEDLYAPMIPSTKRRGLWLGINLVTVFMAAWVIGQFEAVLDKYVALAVLMPVVASMGGIAGSQTLTLVIRGMALNQIAASNVRWLAIREVGVGALNGLVWSAVVALMAYMWFQDIRISVIIGIALILNLLAAALSGISIPLVLKKFGIDPALSGAVILTTVTDILGFLSFLGLASIFLL